LDAGSAQTSTGHRNLAGNTYAREEELIRQFGKVLQAVRIPIEEL
jgi:hypothetical protein